MLVEIQFMNFKIVFPDMPGSLLRGNSVVRLTDFAPKLLDSCVTSGIFVTPAGVTSISLFVKWG